MEGNQGSPVLMGTASSVAEDRVPVDYDGVFGNDSGEDEDRRVLADYFVATPSFSKFFSPQRPLEIVSGRKGMGKSALLSYLHYCLCESEAPIDEGALVVKVTGNELVGLADFSGADQARLENRWKQVICKRISLEIGSRIGFAASVDSMQLVEAAELEGFKGKNLVSSLALRFGSLLGPAATAATGGVIDVKAPAVPPTGTPDYLAMLRRYLEDKPRNVWVLIDDVDAKFLNTEEQHQRVGAFLSAIRSLAFNVEGLRIRASIRVDVLTNLRYLEDADKLRQYIRQISWSDEALRRIFTKKILSYFKRTEPHKYDEWSDGPENYRHIVALVFGRNFVMYKQGDADPFNIIMSLAGKRPRWIGQLCKLAGAAAGSALIDHRHFDAVMEDFGREKISDLCKEHAHQFPDITKLTEAFRHSARELSRHKLLTLLEQRYVQKVGVDKIPQVNGYGYKEPAQLAEFLFKVDFLAGKRGERWIAHFQEPTLFESHENDQNRIQWCVNLSYRGYLGITR